MLGKPNSRGIRMKLFIFKHYLNISSKMKEARPTTNITAAQWREVRKVFDPNSQYDHVSFLKVLLRMRLVKLLMVMMPGAGS